MAVPAAHPPDGMMRRPSSPSARCS